VIPVDERPTVPVDVSHLLPVVAAHGLAGAPAFPDELPVTLSSSLVTAARSSRLTGPLLAAVRAGSIGLSDEAESLLVDAHREALIWCLQLEQRLLEVHDLLERADVPCVVVKGPAIAHLDLADPAERTWADVDILVPPSHIDRAVRVLLANGGVRPYAEPRPGWDRRFAKSVEVRAADQIEVDVHRSLADGVYGERIPLDHLHQTTEPFELGGQTLRALSPPARVVHAAYHAVVGSMTPTWSNRRDLARYFTERSVPVAAVVEEARLWRGEAVLWAAVDLVRRDLQVDAGEWYDWADATVVLPRERVLVSRPRHGDAGLGRARLDLVRELPSLGDRVAYLRALAFPVGAKDSAFTRYRRWLPHVFRRG
jgi:hypothetical protein